MTGAIPLARPWLADEEAEAARAAVLSGWVMQGPRVAEFETAFARHVGAAHACAVSSGTAALVLALKAVGVGHGDVVLTVSHSFIATANAVRACGAEPVFVDIEPDGYNIDPLALAATLENDCRRDDGVLRYAHCDRLTGLAESPLRSARLPVGRVAAILAVHQMGFPCAIADIDRLASRYGLPWIEDAACAVGSEWNGIPIGRPHGAAACFSFHPRKVITTGDGGMVTTAAAAIDARCRHLRQHAMVPAPTGRGAESYECTAYNYRLTDIQAAVGTVQLGRLGEIVERRRERAAHYRRLLKGNDRFRIFPEPPGSRCNWQSLPVDVAFDLPAIDDLVQALAAQGIAAKPGIMNAHQQAPYGGVWHLPRSEQRRARTILLPLYHDLAPGDIERVVEALDRAGRHA